MYELEIKLNQFLLGYFDAATRDIAAGEWAVRHPVGGHSPLWIAGHLAFVADMAGQRLGLPPLLAPEWHAAFGIGSAEDVAQPERFPKDAVLGAVRRGYARLYEPVRTAPGELLAAPHGIPFMADTPVQTLGELLALVLTGHFGLHLGQLTVWRRQHGRAPMF